MRIGLLFPSVYGSPALYGKKMFAPRELLSFLADGLVKRQHEVFVFSTQDFPTTAQIISTPVHSIANPLPYSKFRGLPQVEQVLLESEFAKRNFELNTILNAFKYAREQKLDILHVYHDSSLFLSHYFQELVNVPVVYSLHDPLPPPHTFEYQELERFSQHHYIAISQSQKVSLLTLNFAGTVYHGMPLNEFSYQKAAADYLLFMGRLIPEKGLDQAIAACLGLNMRLEIGTQFPDREHESDYFKGKIKPYLTNPLIGEPGVVDGENKQRLYQGAKALLFPISWEEPFGLVMVEAMACGTPVIAYNRGSVPGIVKDGVTGFIVEPAESDTTYKTYKAYTSYTIKKRGIPGLVEAIKRIGEIDRQACRRHVEENFSVEKMTLGYEEVYKDMIQKSK